jgi:hypothetical protein
VLRTDLAAALRDDELAPGFVTPDWDGYCFGNVPDTVRSLCGADARRPLPDDVFDGVDTDAEHVVLLFVDGFGWTHFRRARGDHPFLDTLAERATVTPLTSIYPTETAAAVTTVTTGTQPCEHGVLGWNAHVPELGGQVNTLPFTDGTGDPLDGDPATLMDEEPIFTDLPDPAVVTTAAIAESDYSEGSTNGTEAIPYDDVAQGLCRLRARLEAADGPTFTYVYTPVVDTRAHAVGAGHPETDAALASVLAAVERELLGLLDDDTAAETLLLLTADHGEVDAGPDERVPLEGLDLDPHLARDADGDPIPAQGGPRNIQLHARDGHVEALAATVEGGLSALDPLVVTGAVAERMFGDREPSDRFRRRCPDVLAIPDAGYAWYEEKLDYAAMHGGCHPEEMLVPFAAARLDTLRG